MRVLRFRACEKNTLRAVFDLQLDSGIILRGCTLHLSHGRHWVGMPGRPYRAADGADTWANIVDFADKATKDRFQKAAAAAALAAYQRSQPEAVA